MTWEKRANHTQGSIARGGKLAHDGTRLTFVPHAIDGLRKRLRVVTADGQRHLFLVTGLASAVADLRAAVAAARG